MTGTEAAGKASGKGDRTRRRILDAAARTFAGRGVAATGIGEIADAAGLKAGSLYFHFESKDAIVAEVLRLGIAESLAHLHAALAAAGPQPGIRLKAAITAHVEVRARLSDYAVVLLDLAERGENPDDRFEAQRRDYLACWQGLVEAAQAAGHLPAAPAQLVLGLLLGAMNLDLRGRWPTDEAAAVLSALIDLKETT